MCIGDPENLKDLLSLRPSVLVQKFAILGPYQEASNCRLNSGDNASHFIKPSDRLRQRMIWDRGLSRYLIERRFLLAIVIMNLVFIFNDRFQLSVVIIVFIFIQVLMKVLLKENEVRLLTWGLVSKEVVENLLHFNLKRALLALIYGRLCFNLRLYLLMMKRGSILVDY
jgi:hypothetical protein